MYHIIGIILGLLINHFLIKPLEQKYYKELCYKEGLVELNKSDNNHKTASGKL